jgi:hypothetical protein
MKSVFSKQDFQKVKESEHYKKRRSTTMKRIDRNTKEPDFNKKMSLPNMKEPDFNKKQRIRP